jgi:cytochrome oxidase Cu insertion factor (SCO1/SenC/PrrC family)
MAEIVCQVESKGFGDIVVPIFISCDPKRDSIEAIKEYVSGKSNFNL